jgi:hypothetical protein
MGVNINGLHARSQYGNGNVLTVRRKVYCRSLQVLNKMKLKLALWIVASGIFVLALLILVVGSASAEMHPSQLGPGGGMAQGNVYGFTMFDEREPIVWAQVTAVAGQYKFQTSTGAGGAYSMFLPTGTYNFTVDAGSAYKAQSQSVTVSNGGTSSVNFYLEQSHVPIPEFPTQLLSLIMVAAFAAALITQRKIRAKHELPSQ